MRDLLRNGGSVLETSPLIAAFLLVSFALVGVHMIFHVPVLGARAVIVDFDAFYIVGQLAQRGELASAYHFPAMRAAQTELSGTDSFMPWTYPPQFDLVVALLPLLPRGLSYGLFIALTFTAWLIMLRALSGRYFAAVLLATAPAIIVGLRIGQNGFLTGALVGGFCLLLLRGRGTLAGVPLGLMVIKPHLGIGLGVLALAQCRWRTLGVALAIVALSSALATLVFGPSIWLAFRAGVDEAGGFLAQGLYPLFRMSSLYAALHRLGVDPETAIYAQIVLAVLALAIIARLSRRAELRLALAAACLLTLVISPYTYDYDMTIFGIGLALAAPDIIERCTPVQRLVLLALSWVSCGWGLMQVQFAGGMEPAARVAYLDGVPSVGGFTYPLMLGLAVWFCLRPTRTRPLSA